MNNVEFKSLSVSKLRLYIVCPRQYYYAYGEGIFQKESPAILFGTYVHDVLEGYLKNLLKTSRQQDLEALYSIANDKKTCYEAIPETGNLSFFEADLVLNRFAAQNVDPEKVFAVEKFFSLPVGNSNNVTITGRIDRIDVEKEDDSDRLLHIIDYKTGKNELTQKDLENDIQMKFYITGAYLLYRKLFNRFRFSLYYLTDNNKVSFETDYNNDYLEEISMHIETIASDTEYNKKTGKHCRICPAFNVCNPELK